MGRLLLRDAQWIDPEAAPDASPDTVAALLVRDGRIEARLAAGEEGPADAERVSLGGARVTPGFLDVHLHGELVFASDDALHDALTRLAASCLRHGVTGFLPTSVAWGAERLNRFVTRMVERMTQIDDTSLATPLGIHLEGPWIRIEAAGAQPPRGIRPYDPREGAELLDRAEGGVRMVTLAPEAEGAGALLRDLSRRGVVAAAGHSLASATCLEAAVADGVTHVTHLFNAMGALHHREPGLAGRALVDDRLTCDLICDGAHVAPEMVALAARAKGDRLLWISDRIEPPPEGADFGAGAVRDDGCALRLPDGTLAGSTLTLDRALRNAGAFAGLTLAEAVAGCTLRPARLLGIEAERGTLRPGARADLAVLDEAGRVTQTWLAGRRVYSSERATP